MKKCLVVYNPNSGKYNKEVTLPKIEKILNEYDYSVIMEKTKYKGDATSIVANIDKCDLVVSIGGDGTFNEVMTGNFMRKDRIVLCHLPSGTTNDVGAMWGYGKNMLNNLKLALNGKVKRIDICTINDKPFVYSAGFGKFMNIPYETPRELKKRIGHLAYIREGARDFFRKVKLYDITYEVDNEKYRGLFSFALITNANRVAGINNFYKDIKLDDNKFEVLLCNITKLKDIVKTLYFFALYDASKIPGFYFYQTDNIKIKFNSPLKKPLCIDGESFDDMSGSYNIKIDHDVYVLMPSKNINSLFVEKKKKL
ncbi:MAG: YegS/Rv2252/BmrU family lipid kinase [Firmicutes bacterium]|nr:YegS/Rv2252/BmrU family lipid kinase [Bacillota bacterium]MDY5336154.1 YegS/Rv2252/BmrU family lipid kinase [Bacilli bacterium]